MSKIYRLEITALNLLSLQEQVMTAHIQTDTTVISPEPAASEVLDDALSALSTSGHNCLKIANVLYNTCRLTEAVVREEVLDPKVTPPATAAEALNVLGVNTASGDATPDGLCPFIFFKTDVASRSSRGGTHVPGPFNANILDSAGRWDTTAGWWGSLSTLAGVFSSNPFGSFGESPDLGHFNWVVYSRTRRKRDTAPWTFKITQAGGRVQPRWLRRRMTRG